MRSIFFILSDDHLGSTPLAAPGSMVQAHPDPVLPSAANDSVANDEVMEVSDLPSVQIPGSSQGPKRKLGHVFSGSSGSKQPRTQSQT